MQELIISYPRSLDNFFRIREDINAPGKLVQSISGQSLMVCTDNEAGRLHVMADVEYSEHVGKAHAKLSCTGNIHIPKDVTPVEGYWRICFRRQKGDWRVRLEGVDGSDVIYVDTYEGVINHDWYDETAHLYHKGYLYHYDNKALFVPGVATRPPKVQETIDYIESAYNGTLVTTDEYAMYEAALNP